MWRNTVFWNSVWRIMEIIVAYSRQDRTQVFELGDHYHGMGLFLRLLRKDVDNDQVNDGEHKIGSGE